MCDFSLCAPSGFPTPPPPTPPGNYCTVPYTVLWRILLGQSKIVESLSAAEKGRAQALTDFMRSQHGVPARETISRGQEENNFSLLSNIPFRTIFQAFCKGSMNFWVLGTTGESIQCRQIKLDDPLAVYNIPGLTTAPIC